MLSHMVGGEKNDNYNPIQIISSTPNQTKFHGYHSAMLYLKLGLRYFWDIMVLHYLFIYSLSTYESWRVGYERMVLIWKNINKRKWAMIYVQSGKVGLKFTYLVDIIIRTHVTCNIKGVILISYIKYEVHKGYKSKWTFKWKQCQNVFCSLINYCGVSNYLHVQCHLQLMNNCDLNHFRY